MQKQQKHSNSTLQDAGQEVDSTTFQHHHSHSTLQDAGQQVDSKTFQHHHSHSSLRDAGPGETAANVTESRQVLCRVCETVGDLDSAGRCAERGCMVVATSEFSMPRTVASWRASQIIPKTPKNSIPQNPKNGIPQIPKKEEQHEAGHCDPHDIRWIAGTSDCELVHATSQGSAEMVGALSLGECRQLELSEDTGGNGPKNGPNSVGVKACLDRARCEAEGSEESPEEAERQGERSISRESVGVDVVCCVWLADDSSERDSEAGSNPANDEEPRVKMLIHREHEESCSTSTEDLKEHSNGARGVHADQKDVEDLTWLDECQLRLSSQHQDALESWIQGDPKDYLEAGSPQVSLQRTWETIEDIRHELRSLCIRRIAEDAQGLVSRHPEEPW